MQGTRMRRTRLRMVLETVAGPDSGMEWKVISCLVVLMSTVDLRASVKIRHFHSEHLYVAEQPLTAAWHGRCLSRAWVESSSPPSGKSGSAVGCWYHARVDDPVYHPPDPNVPFGEIDPFGGTLSFRPLLLLNAPHLFPHLLPVAVHH